MRISIFNVYIFTFSYYFFYQTLQNCYAASRAILSPIFFLFFPQGWACISHQRTICFSRERNACNHFVIQMFIQTKELSHSSPFALTLSQNNKLTNFLLRKKLPFLSRSCYCCWYTKPLTLSLFYDFLKNRPNFRVFPSVNVYPPSNNADYKNITKTYQPNPASLL